MAAPVRSESLTLTLAGDPVPSLLLLPREPEPVPAAADRAASWLVESLHP